MAQGRNERSTEAGKRFAGYQVYDRHYEKVGKVDGIFVDEGDQPEYIGMKIDFFGSRSALIPMDIVRVNDTRRLVEVAADKKAIKESPSFGDDAEITTVFEDRVYTHFGARRASGLDGGGDASHQDGGSGVDVARGERADDQMPEATGETDRVPGEAHEAHSPQEGYEEKVDATDAARRKAGKLDVDLASVEGTGTGGRVIVSDVTESAGGRQPVERSPETPTGPELSHAGERRDHAEPDAGPSTGNLVYDQDAGRQHRETDAGEVGPGMRMGDTESGEFRGHASDDEGVGQRRGSDLDDEDELRVQRSEEELTAHTREREAGSVSVRKRVRIDRERLSVPTRREEVSVERVPTSGEAAEAHIGAEEVTVPVVEDEVVVHKRPVVKEEIRVRKDVVEEQQIVEEDVRREEVEVEDATTRRREE